jgi:queuosine biosynthesis protein QueC
MSEPRAVVLLSGGLDSTTVLAIARSEGLECHCLTVDYGQRHRVELKAARRVADTLGAASHRVIGLDLRAIGGSALTDDIEVPKDQDPESGEIPITYVPARNTVLLSLLLGLAEVVEADQLFIGANAVDYSGYPDCRPAFLQAFESLAAVATVAGPKPTSSAAGWISVSITASPGRATTRPPMASPAGTATRASSGCAALTKSKFPTQPCTQLILPAELSLSWPSGFIFEFSANLLTNYLGSITLVVGTKRRPGWASTHSENFSTRSCRSCGRAARPR